MGEYPGPQAKKHEEIGKKASMPFYKSGWMKAED